MGIKGKLLGRLKRRSAKPSDPSNTITIASSDVVRNNPEREKHSAIDSSPIRLPVLRIDPDGRAADDFEIPLTPGTMKNGNDGANVSPDHTNSTQSWSVKSEVSIWNANGTRKEVVVPSMVVEAGPEQQFVEKSIFTEIADRAFKLAKNESMEKEKGRENVVEISDEKSVNLVKINEVAVIPNEQEDRHQNTQSVDAVQFSDELNYPGRSDRKETEVPCGPIDLDDDAASEVADTKSRKSLSERAKDVVIQSKSSSKENIDSTVSKVMHFGRAFNKGALDSKTREVEGRLEVKGGTVGKKEAGKGDDKTKARLASPVKPLINDKDPGTSQEEENIPSTSSLINAIEDQVLTKSPSDEESNRSRKVSFDESNHASYAHYEVEEEDDSSYDSEEECDDDSHYYDDHEGYDYDDDYIDEATHLSGDSMILNHDDIGIWAWLCGYDNCNASPNSIEDAYEEKSVATVVTGDGRESVLSFDDSVDVDEGATVDEGEEMSYNEEAAKKLSGLDRAAVRQSSGTLSQKFRAVTPTTKMPGLLKKKDLKHQRAISEQPRDSQGFPLEGNKSRKSSTSGGKQVGQKMHSTNDDVTAASASPKRGRRQGLGKDTRQLEIYCKRHGGVENLVLRKYPSAPLPKGRDHILVKVEASTVSSRDCLLRLHGDPKLEPSPSVPGFQIVGTIFALGAGLKSRDLLQRGDRVAALTNGGGNARYVSIPASDAILLPPTATHESLVCLVSNYMTAYQSLKLAKMKKGGAPLTNCNVLITGGSGPVGQALIDLASREGARVITTAHQMHEEVGRSTFASLPFLAKRVFTSNHCKTL
eukprot:CCRYP_017006-RA/>CCRYP_017006-RA protein AED:0.18 eAED:0.18 QI:495/1/1/1/1/1/2/844/816